MTVKARTPGRSRSRPRTSAMISQAERRCAQSLNTLITMPLLKISKLLNVRGRTHQQNA